jgi:hypothetical protein
MAFMGRTSVSTGSVELGMLCDLLKSDQVMNTIPAFFPRLITVWLVACVFSSLGEVKQKATPAVFVPAEGAVPDLMQTDPKGGFARDGKSFCGPVAVSNSLMALFSESLAREKIDHYALVNLLAAESHMKTHAVNGTGTKGLIRGVEEFLRRRDLEGYSLRYQGWRSHPEGHGTGVKIVELDWMREAIAAGGAVWINLGWYAEKDDAKGDFVRVGGHWVTVVGYGRDENDKADADVFLIHDPATRAGARPSVEYVRMTQLEGGRMMGRASGKFLRNLKGMHRMAGGMHIKSIADCAIIDGAVAMFPPKD